MIFSTRDLPAIRSRTLEIQGSVQAAGAVAFKVKGHIKITEHLKTPDDLRPHPFLDDLGKFRGIHLDPGDGAVVADPELAETEPSQVFLSPADLTQALSFDL
jgi:hypothetical protein